MNRLHITPPVIGSFAVAVLFPEEQTLFFDTEREAREFIEHSPPTMELALPRAHPCHWQAEKDRQRLRIAAGQLPVPEIDGEQHSTFEDTIPRAPRVELPTARVRKRKVKR